MEKKYNYVYITTNLINEKQYVGDHSTNNLNDNYLGSGLYLKRSIKKHGNQNFKREILVFFNTKQEAFENQTKYIKKYKTLISENGYNISLTGGVGVSSSLHNEETKRKIGNANRGNKNGMYGKKPSKKTIEKWKDSHKEFKHSAITKEKMKHPHKMTKIGLKNICESNSKRIWRIESKEKMKQSKIGFVHTIKTKEKMRVSHSGKILSKDQVEAIKRSVSKEKNGMYGKKHTILAKEKMRNQKKIKCVYCEIICTLGNYNRWHGKNCKYKI